MSSRGTEHLTSELNRVACTHSNAMREHDAREEREVQTRDRLLQPLGVLGKPAKQRLPREAQLDPQRLGSSTKPRFASDRSTACRIIPRSFVSSCDCSPLQPWSTNAIMTLWPVAFGTALAVRCTPEGYCSSAGETWSTSRCPSASTAMRAFEPVFRFAPRWPL